MVALLALLTNVHAGEITVVEDQQVERATVSFVSKRDGVKVGMVLATEKARRNGAVVFDKFYDEICSTPCTVELDSGWHELHFADRRREATKMVRVDPGAQTIRVRAGSPTGVYIGQTLTYFIISAPVGLPVWLASLPGAKHVD